MPGLWPKPSNNVTSGWRGGEKPASALFIHWGLYCVPGRHVKGQQMPEIGEWIMSKYRIHSRILKARREVQPGEVRRRPMGADWQAGGNALLMITAKHHDGFAMSIPRSDPYNIFDATPFQRDPAAELATACKKYGLKFGFYYSQALGIGTSTTRRSRAGWSPELGGMSWGNDWDFPDHGAKRYERYFEKKVKPQLRELC